MKIFEAYNVLKRGQSLSLKLIQSLINSKETISDCQWSSLFAFLCSKTKTADERSFVSWLIQHVPICSDLLPLESAESHVDMKMIFIQKLNRQERLGEDLVRWWIQGVSSETLSKEFISFCLGKIFYHGLAESDISLCTLAMKASGTIHDYRNLKELDYRKIVRRYPTGALSEKTALLLPALLSSVRDQFPIATAFLVAKSLSYTGGTWDKLSAIPGFVFPIPGDDAIRAMQQCGVAMSVTQHNANPADRILYQLRNETGTVESNALIISSITSKQLTFPADQLLLDVRYGPGAFFPNRQKASSMANSMTTLLCNEGIPTSHQLTDTSEPNGSSIGNALEIIETLAILKGSTSHEWRIKGLQTQRELVLRFFITLLNNTFPNIPKDTLYKIGCESIDSGKALNAFFDILHSHSVPASVIKSLRIDPWPVLLSNIHPFSLLSPQTGVISFIDQKKLGTIVNFVLGKEDKRFGLQLHKGLHDTIQAGELLAHVYAKTIDEALVHDLASCFKITTLPS